MRVYTCVSPSVFCKCQKSALLYVSLQTAVMVRVGTEENDDDENLSEQGRDEIVKASYNLTSSKHSTAVSGEITVCALLLKHGGILLTDGTETLL